MEAGDAVKTSATSSRIRIAPAACRTVRLEPAGPARVGEGPAAHRSRPSRWRISSRPAKRSSICGSPRKPQPARGGAAIRVDFGGLPDTEAAVQKLRIEGASLDPKEIFDLFALLDRAADAKSVLTAAAERFPAPGRARRDDRRVPRAAARRSTGRSCRTARWRTTPASRWRVCGAISSGRRRAIQESLERFLRAHREEGVLQEEFVTIRNERFVVPIIAGQRGGSSTA